MYHLMSEYKTDDQIIDIIKKHDLITKDHDSPQVQYYHSKDYQKNMLICVAMESPKLIYRNFVNK